MNRYLALFLLVIIIECSPESEESSSEQTSIISPSQPATPVSSNNSNSTSNGTELVSPNLNEGSINFGLTNSVPLEVEFALLLDTGIAG